VSVSFHIRLPSSVVFIMAFHIGVSLKRYCMKKEWLCCKDEVGKISCGLRSSELSVVVHSESLSEWVIRIHLNNRSITSRLPNFF
jgi:hypothetical protein